MTQGHLNPVLRQQVKTLVRPFDGCHGLAREILHHTCRFKLAERANAIPVHVGQWQTPLVFVNHDEGRTGDCRWRCAKTLRDSANERRLAGSERSVERDRFPSPKRTSEHLA